MATVTFAGTTLWNDSSTGVGPVAPAVALPTPVYQITPLARSGVKLAKRLGTDAGRARLVLPYVVTSAEFETLRSTIGGVAGLIGTLAVPPGQSYGSALLIAASVDRGSVREVGAAGTPKWGLSLVLVFELLK